MSRSSNTSGTGGSAASGSDRWNKDQNSGSDKQPEALGDSYSNDDSNDRSRENQFSGPMGRTDVDEESSTNGNAPTNHAADKLKAHAHTAKEHVAAAGHEVAAVAHEVGDATRELRTKVSRVADRERGRAADVVSILSDAVRDAGQRLLAEPRTRELGIWGDVAADRVNDASRYLRNNDASTMIRHVSQQARQRPEIFLGIMATAGLALARFIKATERRPVPPNQLAAPDSSSYDSDVVQTKPYNNDWSSSHGRLPIASQAYSPSAVGAGEIEDDLLSDPTPRPAAHPRLSQTEEGL